MTNTLRIAGNGKDIDLYPWLTTKAKGMEALAGIVGFGLPDVENFWFDGAGSGSSWRGSRVKRREIELPLWVYAENRADLAAQLSDLSTVLDPFHQLVGDEGPATLYFGGPDDNEWYARVVRKAGGKWRRKVDSDDRKYFQTTITLEAGDSFWTRNKPERFEVVLGDAATTLMPYMAKLQVTSAAAFGVKTVTNTGDTYAWPVVTVKGPTDGVALVGPTGQVVEWIDTLLLGETLVFDMKANTVELDGVNRYDALSTAPDFWSIAPGSSNVTVQADNATSDTSIVVQWWPRRWAVI